MLCKVYRISSFVPISHSKNINSFRFSIRVAIVIFKEVDYNRNVIRLAKLPQRDGVPDMETLQIKINESFELASIVDLNGELMQVTIAEAHRVNVGDYLLCIFYGKEVYLRVLAINGSFAYLLTPYKQKDVFSDQRRTVRIGTHLNALVSIRSTLPPVPARIHDFSHRGIGFSCGNSTMEVLNNYQMTFQTESGQSFSITFQIQHRKEQEDGDTRYGASFGELGKEDVRTLRSLILREQLRLIGSDEIAE